MASERQYEGTELELFEGAVNWKAYWAAKVAPFIKGAVLEVGAGLGANLAHFGNVPGTRWTLLEPDRALCDEIHSKIRRGELPAQTNVVCGMLRDLPAEQRFDSIVLIDVLEHIEDDRGQLAEVAARLLPGGHLVVLSPAFQFVFSRFDAAIGHYRRYDRRSLLALTPLSLRPVKTFYLDSLGLLLSIANRFLFRQSAPSPATVRTWDSVIVPLSRFLDPIVGHRTGRSIIGIWSKKANS